MTKNLSLLSRAAVISGIVAFAALPALAQNSQPAAPNANAPTASSTASKQTSGETDHKADAKAEKGKLHAQSGKDKMHKQSATAPNAKTAEEPAKTTPSAK